MKTKRLLSGLITVAMLLSLCVTTAFAANSGYKAGLTVEKKDENKLSVSCDAGPSGSSVKIQAVQTFIVAFDLEVLKPLLKNGTKEISLGTFPEEKAMAYEVWENPDTLATWDTKVYPYKSSDGKVGFMLIQPANGETATLTETISLAKIYLGFQTGKSYADVKEDTVRFATAAELKGMSEDKAIRFNDGTDANGFEWSNGEPGKDTLTFAPGNEPKVEAKGFTFAGTSTPVTLTGIKVKAAPSKVTYTEGESFDKTGMVIEATYSDSSKKDVTGYTYTPTGALTTSDTTITISYTEGGETKTCTQAITVNAAPPAPTEYTITFNVNGGSGTIPSQTTSGQKLSSLPTATHSGSYSFVGWYTAASGGTQITTAYTFSADTTVYAHWIYTGGGGGGGGSYTPSYTVSVDKTVNGTITVSPKSASKGDTVTITVKPDKGYELDTLKVLDKDGGKVKFTEKNGKYTFTMPAGKVTVKGSFVEEAPEQIFADVPVDAYCYEAVKWAASEGITGGIGNNLFAPGRPCTRGQIVTFLWRAAGSPAPKNMSSFADVAEDAYYAKAVAWAVENGITGGTGNGKFSPDATCTRAQAVTFLYRASGSPAVSGSAAFSDVAADAYYASAVKWAEKNGITGGIGGGLFGSSNNCTRGQIVTFLYRAMK